MRGAVMRDAKGRSRDRTMCEAMARLDAFDGAVARGEGGGDGRRRRDGWREERRRRGERARARGG